MYEDRSDVESARVLDAVLKDGLRGAKIYGTLSDVADTLNGSLATAHARP